MGCEFQSSPARGGVQLQQQSEVGCVIDVSILTRPWGRVQHGSRKQHGESARVSILTRPWGRVQLQQLELQRIAGLVSILTRPWGRVQRSGDCGHGRLGSGFNPHPPVGAGATSEGDCHQQRRREFQSSPARGGGCNACSLDFHSATGAFQSSPARGGGCNKGRAHDKPIRHIVSILTRPWGRVQHIDVETSRELVGVSILTRPWGRVQQGVEQFAQEDGEVSILTRPWGRVQPPQRACRRDYRLCFNPHPPVGAGATHAPPRKEPAVARFNPHLPVGAGATLHHDAIAPGCGVSILTRLWGRVQRCMMRRWVRLLGSFNPHPPVGAGATKAGRTTNRYGTSFQSSPARGGGCN